MEMILQKPKRAALPVSKVRALDALSLDLTELRGQGKTIVHCHGVFDLLHIGHIRHFEEAKRHGEILVVTVTPDRFVNKGSHRPVFSENLRVEAIAALECVDFVAINDWATAVSTIRMLKPNVFVKGPDYKDAEKDNSGGIALEEAAIRAEGGSLVFTDNITFSSSGIINRHIPVFPSEVRQYLDRFSQKYTTSQLVDYVSRLKTANALVVGDTIIDEYQYCTVIGKSSKEPTLVAKLHDLQRFAGGVLAVGNHMANFCKSVSMVTSLGETHSEESFVREKTHPGIALKIVLNKNAPTIVKRRYIDRYFFTKLFETYEIDESGLDPETHSLLCQMISKEALSHDVVLVTDYGHGLLGKEAIELLCSKAPFIAVNTQQNAGNFGYHTISKYPSADFVSLAEHELRLEARKNGGDLRPVVANVASRLQCSRMIITRGSRGCLCYDEKTGFFEVPSFATKIVDRVGAGDTFFAITSLLAYQDVPMEVIGFIGNIAGAEAVGMVANESAITPLSLTRHIESLLK